MCTATKLLAVVPLLALACSTSARQCYVDADCSVGTCSADGLCVEGTQGGSTGTSQSAQSSSSSAGATGSSQGSGSSGGQGNTSGSTSSTSGGSGGACTFTGSIARTQVALGPGLEGTYEIAEDAGFDTTGQALPDGGFLWNFTGPFSNDHQVLVQTQAVSGEWFASDYPDASYATALSDLSTTLGIFDTDDAAISLAGLASPTNAGLYTEVSYSPVVPVLSFPLQLNSSWNVTSTVSGTLLGFNGSTYTEAYASQVDKTGLVILPNGQAFPVLRVRTDLTRTQVNPGTQRTYAFVTPCFGSIATVVSQPNETQVEFQTASELRRLTAP